MYSCITIVQGNFSKELEAKLLYASLIWNAIRNFDNAIVCKINVKNCVLCIGLFSFKLAPEIWNMFLAAKLDMLPWFQILNLFTRSHKK